MLINVGENYMQLDVSVKIQADKLSKTEYLIKDINDIIIGRFSTMELEGSSKTCDIKLKFYREYIKAILLVLKKVGLQLDIKKCKFNTTKVKYSSLIISIEGMRIDLAKV